MVYCVADIHGELDKFERLLELVQFSDCHAMITFLYSLSVRKN